MGSEETFGCVCVLFNGCANGFTVPLYVNTYQTICLNMYNLLYVNDDAINDKKRVIASRVWWLCL